ncbi:MAG: glutamine amidotransferase, partial [Streptococcus lutetiensis]|nr:glutamine amidotransferase [Streptococcus lutetiensis]
MTYTSLQSPANKDYQYELNVAHLYGNLMNTYGDNGNILMMKYVGEKLGAKMTFDIVGIFSGKKEETFTGMSSDLSENQIFLHYDDASQLLDLTDKLVTKLSFGIKNPDRINQVI